MSEHKLSAPVGLSPRGGEGIAVKNSSADVVLVRRMLEANGIRPLGTSGKMDVGLLKAIKKYQAKIGFKMPDMVIDPGGKTVKSLNPKYKALVKEETNIKMIKVTYRGKTLLLTEADFEKMRKDIFKKVDRYTKSLISNHKFCLETYQDYLDTAQMKDGIFNAVAQAIIITAGSVKMPDIKIATRSIAATGKLKSAVAMKDLAMLNTALPEAESAINAFNAEVRRFLKDFTGSAETTVVVLSVTSATCFAVVGVLATPILITGAGLSAGAAAITSGVSVGILQSASSELGKHASGQKLTIWQSVQSVAIDGTIGGLTAGIGNKIPLKFCDKMAKSLAPRLASKVPFMAGKQLEKFIANYLSGAGQESIKSAIGETIKLVGKWMKSGKIPSEKEFDAAVESVLYSLLLGGMVKNMGSFQKKWFFKNKSLLTGTIFPERLAKLAKGVEIPKTLQVKMWAEVSKVVSNEAQKVGYHQVYTLAMGSEKESQLTDMAAKAMLKDKTLQSLIDRELLKSMKKHGIKIK